jgi:hypothetical protein
VDAINFHHRPDFFFAFSNSSSETHIERGESRFLNVKRDVPHYFVIGSLLPTGTSRMMFPGVVMPFQYVGLVLGLCSSSCMLQQ